MFFSLSVSIVLQALLASMSFLLSVGVATGQNSDTSITQNGDNNDARIARLTTQNGSGNTATITQE